LSELSRSAAKKTSTRSCADISRHPELRIYSPSADCTPASYTPS
jgi:hypothetical protein